MSALLLAVFLAAPARAAKPPFEKIMVIVLENTDYKEALSQPYLAALAQRGALLSNYHAIAHPSQPNYVALVAGDPLGAKDDEKRDLDARHLGDLLEAKGRSWGVYAEGYPRRCAADKHIGRYARKHEPFISFADVRCDPARCARIKPAADLDRDAAAGAAR